MSQIYPRNIASIGTRVVSLLTPVLTVPYQYVFMKCLAGGSGG